MSAAPKIAPLLKFDIEVVQGPHKGLRLSFQKEVITLGRGTDNGVALMDDLRISRQHTEIVQSHGQFKFRNLTDKNYTLVNGKKADSGALNSGDHLMLGETEIIFHCPEAAASPTANVLQALGPIKPQLVSARNKELAKTWTQPQSRSPANYNPNPYHQAGPRPTMAPPPPRRAGPPPGASDNGRFRFYMIIGIVGLGLYFFVFSGSNASKKSKRIRGGEEIERSVQQSEENIKTMEERLSERGSLTNKRADENFIKGFRDYQKGQYLRAREYFQIVLNLSPDHVEARKYYELSRIKFDKQIDYNFIEGLKNKDKKNYRMCRSYFSQVMILIQNDRRHPKYDEAQRYLRECSLSLERRY